MNRTPRNPSSGLVAEETPASRLLRRSQQIRGRLLELKKLKDGFRFGSGKAPDDETVRSAWTILNFFVDCQFPIIDVVPGVEDRSVEVSGRIDELYCEAEILGSAVIEASIDIDDESVFEHFEGSIAINWFLAELLTAWIQKRSGLGLPIRRTTKWRTGNSIEPPWQYLAITPSQSLTENVQFNNLNRFVDTGDNTIRIHFQDDNEPRQATRQSSGNFERLISLGRRHSNWTTLTGTRATTYWQHPPLPKASSRSRSRSFEQA